MYFFYSVLMFLLTPFFLLRLWWKGRFLPAYRECLFERFGFGYAPSPSIDIWIHAVSLGEAIAIRPLVEACLSHQKTVLITTMTPTGLHEIKTRFKNRVTLAYIPYDNPFSVNRFYRQYRPKIGMLMETEIWPNLILCAKKKNITLYMINARLSQKSFGAYQKGAFFFKPLLNQLQCILAQSVEDAMRFRKLGVEENRIVVMGNLKFDCVMVHAPLAMLNYFQSQWGEGRLTVILASTHEDEEAQILAYWRIVQEKIPNVLLLIAPRHPERFQSVYQLALKMGFNTELRTAIDRLKKPVDIMVIDTLGELPLFYQLSDYAFVGGSLVPQGGHNVLEPIAYNIPVLTGPYLQNFLFITEALKVAAGIVITPNSKAFVQALLRLQQDEKQRVALIKNATQVFQHHQGALQCCLDIIGVSKKS